MTAEPAERIRVVIADDHALFREGTRRFLEGCKGLAVLGEAGDGEEAVALVDKLRPDVAIIDIAMPRLNGIEATRRIKAIAPVTGVLILSAYEDEHYIFALLEAGAAGYLLKDVGGRELADAVRAVHAGETVLHPVIARKALSRFVPGREAVGQPGAAHPLSDREIQVLRLAAGGMSNKEIARATSLSMRTVEVHLSHIFCKLGVASRTEAVIYGLRKGWLRLEDLP